jgi:hypothetical protein
VVELVVEKLVVAGTMEREGGEKLQKQGQRSCFFFPDFGPKFLLSQAMKCNPIYRRWKRNILSLMVPNRGLWFGW